MTLHLNRQEWETLLDMCNGSLTKVQHQYRDSIRRQIMAILEPKPVRNGWAPMGRLRSNWPSNITKPSRSSSPREPKQRQPKPELTAEQILASL